MIAAHVFRVVCRQRPGRLLPVWILLAVIGSAGCSEEVGLEVHPVEGVVLFAGRPVAEARVTFHPRFEAPAWSHLPLAYTDEAGKFRLSTNTQADGAPPGDYEITVELRQSVMIGEEMVREGRHLLPERYCRPASSGLQYCVVEGNNVVPPLELKSKQGSSRP